MTPSIQTEWKAHGRKAGGKEQSRGERGAGAESESLAAQPAPS